MQVKIRTLFFSFIFFLLTCLGEVGSGPFLKATWGSENTGKPDMLTLEQAFDMALGQNDQIKVYNARSKEAEAGRKGAMADLFLKGQLTYSYTGLDDYQYAIAEGQELQISGTELYHWDVTLIQPLFTGFALLSHYQMAALNAEIKNFENDQKRLDVIRDVNKAYFGVLLSEKALTVASETVATLSAHEADAVKYYDQGLIPYNDLLKSRVALKDAIQQKEKAYSQVRQAKSGLNIILGRNMFSPLLLTDVEIVMSHHFNLEGALTEALAKRPVIQAVALGVKSMEKAVRLARSRYYPNVSLIGVYQQDGEDWDASYNDFSNQKNTIVKVQAEWHLPEIGKIRSDVSKSKHQLEAIRHQLKLTEDSVRLEVENAWLSLTVAEKNIKTAKEGLEQAKENWRITDLQYREQAATSTDVLDARTFLSQANMNYYHALYGYMTALGELKWAMGR